jgi:hypothetical protein
MPLSTEMVANKPLSGAELVEVIVKDLRVLLDGDAMFRSHVAYGKVKYSVSVELTLANPTYPKHVAQTRPREIGPEIEKSDEKVGPVRFTRTREVVSPNVTRIANGLPVTVIAKVDGQAVERKLDYEGKVELPPQPEPLDKVEKL